MTQYYSRLDEVKTGDILLSMGNTPTGSLLRIFTSSDWNHAGIAVRIKHGKIVIEGGDLFVFETNTGVRYDVLMKKSVIGAAISDLPFAFKHFNKVVVRKMKEQYRSHFTVEKIEAFINSHREIPFPSTVTPFIQAWVGIDMDDETEKTSMFCTEIAAKFYHEISGLSTLELFGVEGPKLYALYTPKTFSLEGCNKSIFEDKYITIYQEHCDLMYSILSLLVFGILLIFIVLMVLYTIDRHAYSPPLYMGKNEEQSTPLVVST